MRKKTNLPTLAVLGTALLALLLVITGLSINSSKNRASGGSADPAAADSGLRLMLQSAIAEKQRTKESNSRFICSDFEILSVETEDDKACVYALTHYAEYERGAGGGAKLAAASDAPAVFRAEKDESSPTGWRAVELTFPGEGASYSKDVERLFPKAIAKKALDCDTAYMQQKCERLASEYCSKTGLVYPLSDFGADGASKFSYFCPDPSRYAMESTRIDAAFSLDFSSLRFMLASDFSTGSNICGSFEFDEKSGVFVLSADNSDSGPERRLVFRSVGDILVFDQKASADVPAPAVFEDGAVFYPVNFANTQSAAFGEIQSDIDDDGELESCYLGLGASVKKNLLTLYAVGGKRLEYYNSFEAEYADYEFELSNGWLRVIARGEDGARLHRYTVSTAVNRLFLTEDGKDLRPYVPAEFASTLGLSMVSSLEGVKISKVYYCIDPADKFQTYLGAANIALSEEQQTCSMFFSVVSSFIGGGSYRYEDDGSTLIIDSGAYSYTFRVHGDMLVFDENASNAYNYFGSFTNGAIFSCDPPEIPALG